MTDRLLQQVTKYKRWLKREAVDRPMLGLLWEPHIPPLPGFVEQLGVGSEVRPDHIIPNTFLPWIEQWHDRCTGLLADTFQPFSPTFGIPWVEAIVGCPIIAEPGSLWAKPILASYVNRRPILLDRENPWLRKLVEILKVMVHHSDGRYPVALPAMHGPLDTLAGMRSAEVMCLDFIEETDNVLSILDELAQLYIEVCEILLDVIPPYQGGYVTRMHLWGPGRAITPQNDTATLISPQMYRRYVLPTDQKIVAHFPCQSYHLHSSEFHIFDLLLGIKELTALQVSLEHTLGGRSLEFMLPFIKRILEIKPLILVVCDFETANICLAELPSSGLCLMIAPDLNKGIFGEEYDLWLKEHCI